MNDSTWRLRRAAGVIGSVALLATLLLGGRAAQAGPVPYTDPQAVGRLTLCDVSLHPVTSGSVSAAPFVWRVVGATSAPALFDGKGRTATLYAYQPRPSVPPSQWSGQMLTSSSRYTNAAHPTAQATGGDTSLA